MNSSLLKYSHNYDPNPEIHWQKRPEEAISPTKRHLVSAAVSASIIMKLAQRTRAAQAATSDTTGAAGAAKEGGETVPAVAQQAAKAFAGFNLMRKISESHEAKSPTETSSTQQSQ